MNANPFRSPSAHFTAFLSALVTLIMACSSGGSGDESATGGAAGDPAGQGGGFAGGAGGTSTGAGGTTNLAGATGFGGDTGGCSAEVIGPTSHPVGNYDNMSCNLPDCHQGEVGGWIYASRFGVPWVPGAAITITNLDGSTAVTHAAEDGFFNFGPEVVISSPYKVCVSRCPSTDCNLTPHTSTDCLAAGCHAQPTQRIYVTAPELTGTGGAATGVDCVPPTPGGPYVHAENTTSAVANQPCANCHADPLYLGGYLYDGPTSRTTVPEATVEIIPASGPTISTVTGPDGMFFLGTNGLEVTTQTLTAPYTVCVSRCPTSRLCSLTNGHVTTDDCGRCHDGLTEDNVYLTP